MKAIWRPLAIFVVLAALGVWLIPGFSDFPLTRLNAAELSARTSAIEANSDPAAARSDALALEAQLETQLGVDTAAWQKARDAFSDRHFGYSRYWGSSLREKARDAFCGRPF